MHRAFVSLEPQRVQVTDTIVILEAEDDGLIVVSGSHGGLSSAQFVMGHALKAVFYNDAGIGKNEAGVADLESLDRLGLPALVISHETAEIGKGVDAWENGVVSRCNGAATRFGTAPGMSVQTAARRLADAPVLSTTAGVAPALYRGMKRVAGHEVTLLDSVSMLRAEDRGSLVATDSHGGAVSAEFAARHRPKLVVFNDAGIGRNEAGCAALAFLEKDGVAAAAVDASSACIGMPGETLDLGIVSRANPRAEAMGIVIGQRLLPLIERMTTILDAAANQESGRA